MDSVEVTVKIVVTPEQIAKDAVTVSVEIKQKPAATELPNPFPH